VAVDLALMALELHQGGQIGRFFTFWVIVYFGLFLKIRKMASIFGYIYPNTYFHMLHMHKNMTTNGLSYILGDFITNSSPCHQLPPKPN
jgi:hypothetical protein